MNNRLLTRGGLIAACYTALTLLLLPVSFGVVQFRLSESLTILPIYGAIPIWGLTVGCFLSNLFGLLLGANIAGPVDIFVGTFASFLAVVLTFALGKVRWKGLPILSVLPPIVLNALFIGAELTFVTTGSFTFQAFVPIALQVGLEQVIPCAVIGLALVAIIEKTRLQPQFQRAK